MWVSVIWSILKGWKEPGLEDGMSRVESGSATWKLTALENPSPVPEPQVPSLQNCRCV